MKKYLWLLAFGFWACADVEPLEFDPYDASQVTGVWYQYPDKNWVWYFDGKGFLAQKVYGFNTTLWTNEAAYWTRRDTLRFMDFNTGNIKTLLVEFSSPDTMEIRPIPLGLKNILIRF